MATIITNTQKISVADVAAIVVSDTVQDTDGTYVRAIRFLGALEAGQSDPQVVLEVRVSAATKAAVTIATPPSGF